MEDKQRKYKIELILIVRDGSLSPEQLLGEMCDDYRESYGTDIILITNKIEKIN